MYSNMDRALYIVMYGVHYRVSYIAVQLDIYHVGQHVIYFVMYAVRHSVSYIDMCSVMYNVRYTVLYCY